MRILIYSLNYSPEPTGIGLYSGGLAESLAALGHQVEVIAAVPHYPQWKLFDGFRQWWSARHENGVNVRRCPVYIPARMSGAKRIAHYISFFASSLPIALMRAVFFRPQHVICVAPSLIASPVGLLAARLVGARAQLHVQDFEVEAAFATDHMSSNSTVARAAARFERTMLRIFDRVTTISPEMQRKLAKLGVPEDRIGELRNWAEIDHIQPRHSSVFRDRWDIRTPHVALYSGSIAQKQGIESVIDAARALDHRDDITFVICGNGPRRSVLEDYASGVSNVRFHDLQPMEDLGELLNLATVHLLPQRKEVADLVLPSKLANMLASGRPVVAGVEPGTGVAREVEGAGLICEPKNGIAMAKAISRLISNPELREALGSGARKRALVRWARSAIIDAFDAELTGRSAAPIAQVWPDHHVIVDGPASEKALEDA